MQKRILMIAIVSLTLCIAGCKAQPVEVATTGALPPVPIPVGPIPGPEVAAKFSTNPFSENTIALQEGRKLFVWYNCAGCHGGHAGGGMGPSLRDVTWIYGDSDGHIFDSIAQGRANGMPAWGTKLPQEQIWKLVAYVKSLRTPLEPQPPKV